MPDCRFKTSRSRLYNPLPERDLEVAMIALVRKPPPSFAPSASRHHALHRTAIAPSITATGHRALAKNPNCPSSASLGAYFRTSLHRLGLQSVARAVVAF